MKTLSAVVRNPSGLDSWANYIGQTEFAGWHCLLTQNRDSGCLDRSNFRSALRALGGESEHVRVFRFDHWACGWWEALAVHCDSPVFGLAQTIEAGLESYPVVNEYDFSALESEEAERVWRECYSTKGRVAYIRENSRQFEFTTLADLLSCVRGNYFAGWASELIA